MKTTKLLSQYLESYLLRLAKQIIAVCIIVLLNGHLALASKLDWSGGAFIIKSKTPTNSSTISNVFGSFQLSHRFELLEKIEFSYGYSMSFTKLFAGDYGFGPDMGFVYFPFTVASATNLKTTNLTVFRSERLRPFLTVTFMPGNFKVLRPATQALVLVEVLRLGTITRLE